ncbi:hypothetical protein [Piscinibacter terrae]|uniref:Porin n=1 Tax=Piscinibacter terrae TaxID=2496871 RepID=A0A3N7J3W5_9BURK|nr:hypothetical protein [Albitalea terrae]RQP25562.1 hypothetical protein DZC73_00325 [Albitalea terrae]
MHRLLPASIALALAAPMGAMADTTSDIAALKQEIADMRAAYEARLKQMEERLKAAEASSAAPATAQAAPPAPPVAAAPAPAANTAASGNSNSFNPAMSLILSGTYARTSKDPSSYFINGFKLPEGAEVGPGTRGFSLAETELGISANIDPWLRGSANISLHPDDSVSVEEAFVQTTSLGNGLGIKAGRFFSSIGYLNSQHAHTWDFVDNPLAYQAMLGTQYGDDGVQFTWLAPTDQFIELGLELGRGRSFPGSDASRNGAGMTAVTAHTGGDIGDSHNWRAGVSYLRAKASDQTLVDPLAVSPGVFNGNTSVIVADAVWKWAPNGNATRTNFKLQGEYIRSRRDGVITYDSGGPMDSVYRVAQSGWYLQGVYQFMPRWRAGLRTERLNSGVPTFDTNMSPLMFEARHPRKTTLMLDYSPSEFSRVRLQFARDRSRVFEGDNQLFLQYQMSLGAHGAHSY